ncbi:MAG: alpha-glucosidase [Propionibacteriaceae bacterium]|jgi:oligo-1,6-glucosidase|nr:alpha-glucosidase [Propionibacteriaceae bacterium]
MTQTQPGRPWWKDTVIYQVYPRSFQDSNGDGIGDIEGIISRLDEIAALGAGAIWLSPLYRSPDADNGYDISDYCDIDPRYGTLADFDRLVVEARRRGLRLIMDLVINHTSDQHQWFQASRRREEPYTDYYIWRQPGPNGEAPNNWSSFFMGSAWQWDDARQEYYLHLFDRKQPDLNYHNPAVVDEVEDVLRFWLDRGVAGFRCDVISLLYKTSLEDGHDRPICGLEHYKAQPGTHHILQKLHRDVLGPRGAFTVGETVMVTLDEARDLSEPERGELDLVFYFDHLEVDRVVSRFVPKPFRADELLRRLTVWQQGLSWNAVYFENHDQPRIVSHYGDDNQFWKRSAQLLATMELTLRGTPFIYQGQEIGMTNGDFTSLDQLDDVESHRLDDLLRRHGVPARVRWWLIRMASRDNARTPMQWDGSAETGFTTGRPWLGVNGNHTWLNYAAQVDDPSSILNYYRRLIRLRANSSTLSDGGFEPVYADRAVMMYRRTPAGSGVIGGLPDGVRAGAGGTGSTAPIGAGVAADPAYLVLLNFSGRVQRLKQPWLTSSLTGGDTVSQTGVHAPMIVATNTGRRRLDGRLEPWEAVVVRGFTAAEWTASSLRKP